MLILGLLLLAATAAFTGLVLADNLSGGPDYNVTVLGHHIATMNSLSIFCAGLALALIFGLAAMMTKTGASLHRRRTRKLHEARRDAADTARERDELAARLDRATPEPYAPGPDPDSDSDLEPKGATSADTPRHRHARHLFGH